MRVRRVIILALLCCFMAALTGCSGSIELPVETEHYTVYKENGQYYLQFHQTKTFGDAKVNVGIQGPVFKSLSEMKRAILNGDIQYLDLAPMIVTSGVEGTLKIVDLDQLYDLRLPGGLSYHEIEWYAERYKFSVRSDGKNGTALCECDVYCMSKVQYQSMLSSHAKSHSLNPVAAGDRNAVVNARHADGSVKILCYDLEVNGGVTHVCEEYREGEYLLGVSGQYTSDAVPSSVYLYREENGSYLTGVIYELAQCPTVEWLSGFRLNPL